MRMRRRRAAFLIMLATACRNDAPAPPPAGPRIDAATVPGRIALELWQLRPGITLGAWSPVNLTDQVFGPDSQIAGIPGGWCARSVTDVRAGEQAIVREAFFYPPAPPENLSLPDSGYAAMALNCTLGLMRLIVPGTKPPDADSISGRLDSVFGSRQGSQYQHGSLRIQVGYDATLAAATTTGRFALPSAAPHSPLDTLPLDSIARATGLDSSLWAPLRHALADTVYGEAAQLTQPLVRWVTASQALAAPRRAGALYAADLVLERAQCRFRLCEQGADAALAPLRAAGARFRWSPVVGMQISERAWLAQARALDRDSRLGQSILLAQLNSAFDFSGACGRGPDGFRAVIENGRRYLERVSDSPIAAQVHFYLGEAWRDVVALAGGAGGDFADVSRYEVEADSARAAALRHYRQAIAAGPSPTAHAAWRQAWWLLSGMAPVGTRFFCIH